MVVRLFDRDYTKKGEGDCSCLVPLRTNCDRGKEAHRKCFSGCTVKFLFQYIIFYAQNAGSFSGLLF